MALSDILPSREAPADILPAAKEARNLIWAGYLVGLIITGLVFLYGLIIFLSSLFFFMLAFFGIFWLILSIISFLILYFLVRPLIIEIDKKNYKKAYDNALIAGILSLIFSFVVTGILVILGYLKLGDAVKGGAPVVTSVPPPPPS